MPERNSIEEQQAQLLGSIAAQDRDALGLFYDQTAPAIFSHCFRMLGNTHDAEEVVQDVFVQIWNKAQTFDPLIGIAFHWAMSIARNRCIDRLRSRQRRSRVLAEMEDGVESEPFGQAAQETGSFAGDELAAIRTAVSTLPKDQHQAIEMAFFGGLTHQEIAAALNEPLGTIKTRIRRGMLKLRDTLQAYA